jgi:hypothetical protein
MDLGGWRPDKRLLYKEETIKYVVPIAKATDAKALTMLADALGMT